MFGRGRLVRMWTPHIGRVFAERLASAYAPIRLLTVLLPIWWVIGIFHAVSNGQIRTWSGALNTALPVVLLGILVVTLVQLRRLRNAMQRALSDHGFGSATRPSVFTPSRFRSWLVNARVAPELAAEILAQEGRPQPRFHTTDRV